MSSQVLDNNNSTTPQWKKELIARLRSQNRRTPTTTTVVGTPRAPQDVVTLRSMQLTEAPPPPPPSSSSSSAVEDAVAFDDRCECVVGQLKVHSTMVQETDHRIWSNGDAAKNSDSDSSEELHYGPGIVNRLRNKYLSLALRESASRPRPTILFPMRKATSLENILDSDTAPNSTYPTNHHRQTVSDLKRARSVELLSEPDNVFITAPTQPKPKLLNDEDTPPDESNAIFNRLPAKRINRPLRIVPVISDKEKPPVNVVKQAKMIFERRAEQRTKPPQHTGEVAARIATYKNIIVQAKAASKTINPPVKHYRAMNGEKTGNTKTCELEFNHVTRPHHIPDISRIEVSTTEIHQTSLHNSSLSETPDLILTSSPISSTPAYHLTESNNVIARNDNIRHSAIEQKLVAPQDQLDNTNSSVQSITYNFSKPLRSHPINIRSNMCSSPLQPLQLEINGSTVVGNGDTKLETRILQLVNQNNINGDGQVMNGDASVKSCLTKREIEKNLINTVKTLEVTNENLRDKCELLSNEQTKKSLRQELDSNSIVFNFSDRKEVPDYLYNGGGYRISKGDKPKVGEGGVILLPGASLGESFTDDGDEQLLLSLEAPPSPCDVTFINDNVLIDGKSSLYQKSKRPKMRISFVDSCPEIFEYPSESSLLLEDLSSPKILHLSHTASPLSGSPSLANYTPKVTEKFQPGVTRSVQACPPQTNGTEVQPENNIGNEGILSENTEKPIAFSSSGTNSDILF